MRACPVIEPRAGLKAGDSGLLSRLPMVKRPSQRWKEGSAKDKHHGSMSCWAGVNRLKLHAAPHALCCPTWCGLQLLPSFLAQRPQPHASSHSPSPWLVPSCQQSAICLLLAEGLSLCLIFSRGGLGSSQFSGFTAQRARLELGSPVAFQSRATQETHGSKLLPLWSLEDLGQG